MPKPTTDFRHPEMAAKALYELAGRRDPGKALAPFPYNWRTADRPDLDKTWWVSPPGPSPRYRHGKIICTSNQLQDGATLFIGLYVEKGITPEVAQVTRKPDYALEDNWIWTAFLEAMRRSELDSMAAEIEERAGCAPTVIVDTGNLDRRPHDVLAFRWSQGTLSVLPSPHCNIRGLLRKLRNVRTLAELAEALPQMDPAYDNLWVDLSFGFMFWSDPQDADAVPWSDEKIWRAACEPWSLWLR